jgi:hypothetical protein
MVFKGFTFATLMIALVLNDCGQNDDLDEVPPPQAQPGTEAQCLSGTLVSGDKECPAFRTQAGDLLALSGGVEGYQSGERVCVCGAPAETSTCQQTRVMAITFIGPACP